MVILGSIKRLRFWLNHKGLFTSGSGLMALRRFFVIEKHIKMEYNFIKLRAL